MISFFLVLTGTGAPAVQCASCGERYTGLLKKLRLLGHLLTDHCIA